jgi:hypothetical protein
MAGSSKKYSNDLKPKTAPGLNASHSPLSADSIGGNPTTITTRKAKKAK